MPTKPDISIAKERQLSFRTTPEIKHQARIEAAKQGLVLGEWLNKIVKANLPELNKEQA